MNYREIHVRSVVRGRDVFRADQGWEITKGEDCYLVVNLAADLFWEIPASNVTHAVLEPEPKAKNNGTAEDVSDEFLNEALGKANQELVDHLNGMGEDKPRKRRGTK